MNYGKVPIHDDDIPMLQTVKRGVKYNDTDEIKKSNSVRNKLALKNNIISLNGELYGSTGHSGSGYISAPNMGSGYLNAPNHASRGGNRIVQGGFWPALLGALAPMLIDGIGSLFKGRGVSASDFYNHADHLVKVHHPEHYGKYQKEMHNLFAGKGNYTKILRGKMGGTKFNDLKVGNIVLPPLIAHLQKIHGSGDSLRSIIANIEKKHGGVLEQDIKPFISGSGWLGSIWSFVKSLLTSDGAKQIYKEVGNKALEEGSKLAKTGIEKLGNKIGDKINGGAYIDKNGNFVANQHIGNRNEKKISGGWVVSIKRS